jgi:hypothetical protein
VFPSLLVYMYTFLFVGRIAFSDTILPRDRRLAIRDLGHCILTVGKLQFLVRDCRTVNLVDTSEAGAWRYRNRNSGGP